MKKLLALGIVAVIVAACAPTTQTQQKQVKRTFSPDTAKIWYSVGKDYMQKERYDDAIRNFKLSLEYDSTFVLSYLDMGRAYIEKAKKAYEEAKTLKQSGDDSLANMAVELAKAYLDSAEAAYRQVSIINPKDSRGWQGLGYMYGIVKNDTEKGIEYYKKAIETDPKNYDAMFGLAKLYEKAGQVDLADSLYQTAIAGDTSNIALKRSYGLFLVDQGRYADAITYLEEVSKKLPNDKDVYEALYKSYKALAEQYKDTSKDTATYYGMQAVKAVDGLIKIDTTDATLWSRRGTMFEWLGDLNKSVAYYDSAIACYDRAITLDSLNPAYYLQKGYLLVTSLKRTAEARKVLKQALNLERSGPDIKATVYFLIGNSYLIDGVRLYNQKDYEASMNAFDQAIAYYQKALAEPTTEKWATYRTYTQKMLTSAKDKRQKAWRKYKGID